MVSRTPLAGRKRSNAQSLLNHLEKMFHITDDDVTFKITLKMLFKLKLSRSRTLQFQLQP